MTHSSLATKIRVLRARQGLTLVEAAQKIGVGRDTLSAIEHGHQHPTFPTLKRIAEGYGVDVEELLVEEPTSARLEAAMGGGGSFRGELTVELAKADKLLREIETLVNVHADLLPPNATSRIAAAREAVKDVRELVGA